MYILRLSAGEISLRHRSCVASHEPEIRVVKMCVCVCVGGGGRDVEANYMQKGKIYKKRIHHIVLWQLENANWSSEIIYKRMII